MKFRRIRTSLGIATVTFVVMCVGAVQRPAMRLASQYTEQIAYDQQQISSLQQQLNQISVQHASLTAQQNTALSAALSTQKQINALQNQITTTQTRVDQLNAEYATTVSQIMATQVHLNQTQQELGSMVSYLYKYSQGNPILNSLVNNGNVLKFFDTESNLQSINGKIQLLITSVKQEKAQLQALATQEQEQQLQVGALLVQLQTEQNQLHTQELTYQQQAATLSQEASSVSSQAQSLVNSIASYRQQIAVAQQEQALLLEQEAAARAAAASQETYGGTIIGNGASGNFPDHFPWGQCTWYVATQRYVPWWGNANQWVAGAISYGYSVGMTPKVGSIVVWGGGDGYDTYYGHVAYVVAVQSPTSFTVHEANFYGLGVVDQRQVDTLAGVLGFIY